MRKFTIDFSSVTTWWWSPWWRRPLRGSDPRTGWPGASRNVPVSVAQVVSPPLLLRMESRFAPNQPGTIDVKLFEKEKSSTCWNLIMWTLNCSSSHHFLLIIKEAKSLPGVCFLSLLRCHLPRLKAQSDKLTYSWTAVPFPIIQFSTRS